MTARTEEGSDPRSRPPLTILDITKFYGETTGGIRTYLHQKAAYVNAHHGLRQVIVVPGEKSEKRDEGAVRWYRVRGPRIPTQHPYRFLLNRRAIHEIISLEQPDIIEIGSPYLVPWIVRGAARRSDIPLVLFFHTNFPRIIAPRQDTGPVRAGLSRVTWSYVALLGRSVGAVLAASDSAAKDLERAGVPRVRRVSLGVDLDHFHPRRRSPGIRQASGLPAGPLVMFVGRLAREKNLDPVLAAWPGISDATGATLVLVGDGPSRRRMLEGAGKSVMWIPYIRDRNRLADVIAAADLYLAPGPAETFGLSALEALASGVPVVSSAEGGVADLVRSSGAGAIVDMTDVEDVTAAVTRLLTERDSLSGRAREYAERNHSWETVFDQIFQVYRSLSASRSQ